MLKSTTRLLSYLAFLLLTDTAATAATDDWKLCRGSDQDQRVQACTRLAQNTKLPNKERADAYVELGFLFSGKDAARAIAAYDKAIALDSKNILAYIQRARSNSGLQQYAKAIADASKAIEIDPRSAYAYQVRGYSLHAAKEPDRAIADYDKSIELEPGLMRYFERGGFLLENNEPDRAVADFKKVADLVQSNDEGLNGLLVQIVEKLIQIDRIRDTPYVIGKISDDGAMMRLRSLRRFEKLWSNPSASAALSLEQAHLRNIEIWRQTSERQPKSLGVKIGLIHALIKGNRSAEAEQVGLDSIAALSSFDDAAERESYIRAALAQALLHRDKFDNAQRVMEPMLRKIGKGTDAGYVDVTINYSSDLLDAGRFQAAIDTVKQAEGHVTPYASMIIRFVQACSAHELGREKEAALIVDGMSKDAQNSESTWRSALMCVGLEDKAAELYVNLLRRDPDKLINFQGCANDPSVLPFELELQRRRIKIFERPNVRSVVDPIGRLQQSCGA